MTVIERCAPNVLPRRSVLRRLLSLQHLLPHTPISTVLAARGPGAWQVVGLVCSTLSISPTTTILFTRTNTSRRPPANQTDRYFLAGRSSLEDRTTRSKAMTQLALDLELYFPPLTSSAPAPAGGHLPRLSMHDWARSPLGYVKSFEPSAPRDPMLNSTRLVHRLHHRCIPGTLDTAWSLKVMALESTVQLITSPDQTKILSVLEPSSRSRTARHIVRCASRLQGSTADAVSLAFCDRAAFPPVLVITFASLGA